MTLNQALISATTLSTSASSVTIPVPSGYTDLRLVFSARNDTSPSIWYEHVRLTFNGGGGNYYSKMLYGNGSNAYSADDSGGGSTYAPWAGVFAAGNSTANTFSNCEIYIPNYGVSGVEKSFSGDSVSEGNTGGGVTAITIQAMRWTGTAAITSITLTAAVGNFVAGSSFTLYGISKLGVTPTQTPKATGGDIIKNDGTYWYHAFLSTGAFIPQQALSCDYLVVAGGGGGRASSNWNGFGGAGAGGLIYKLASQLTPASYAVTVGAGGASDTNGNNSVFNSLIAYGGGTPDTAGGSGGGGSGRGVPAPPGGTSTQTSNNGGTGKGNAGGTATYGDNGPYTNAGGGGGGAGAVGGSASGYTAGSGGVGWYDSLTDAMGAATKTGDLQGGHYYYAGGAGGVSTNGTNPAGGYGGGGKSDYSTSVAGSNVNAKTAGLANTGGGGGSSQYLGAGMPGGSGIVIIRYAMV